MKLFLKKKKVIVLRQRTLNLEGVMETLPPAGINTHLHVLHSHLKHIILLLEGCRALSAEPERDFALMEQPWRHELDQTATLGL